MKRTDSAPLLVSALAAGSLFGFGLALSGMVKPEVIFQFLLLHDFGLMLVMLSAALTVMVAYKLVPRIMTKPLFAKTFGTHPVPPTGRAVIGAVIFGVGWGLSGVCPGPAIAGLGVGNWPVLYVVVGLLIGAWLEGRIMHAKPKS